MSAWKELSCNLPMAWSYNYHIDGNASKPHESIFNIKLDWYKIPFEKLQTNKFDINSLSKKETTKTYQTQPKENYKNIQENFPSQERWTQVCSLLKEVGSKVLEKKKKQHTHLDKTIEILTTKKEARRQKMNGMHDEEKRQGKRSVSLRKRSRRGRLFLMNRS